MCNFWFELMFDLCDVLVMRIRSHPCLVEVVILVLFVIVLRLIVLPLKIAKMSMALIEIVSRVNSLRLLHLRIPIISLNPLQHEVLLLKLRQRREPLHQLYSLIQLLLVVCVRVGDQLVNLDVVFVVYYYLARLLVSVRH
jgi:hypothetical protein